MCAPLLGVRGRLPRGVRGALGGSGQAGGGAALGDGRAGPGERTTARGVQGTAPGTGAVTPPQHVDTRTAAVAEDHPQARPPRPAWPRVMGPWPLQGPERVRRMWNTIKPTNRQAPRKNPTSVADDRRRPVFGKDSAGFFSRAGIRANHLGAG